MQQKQFKQWMRVKQETHEASQRPRHYEEGEVWWFRIGENVGMEENGKSSVFSRPTLIVKGFNKQLVWGIPLSNTKNRGKYYYALKLHGKTSVVLISQMRALDTARITLDATALIGRISRNDLLAIKEAIRSLLS